MTEPQGNAPAFQNVLHPTNGEVTRNEPIARRRLEVLQRAETIFRTSPDWVHFYSSVLGAEGIVHRYFSKEELGEFEASEEHEEIQRMIMRLRERRWADASEDEPTKVITVRIPASLHKALTEEASSMSTSMNRLCISKLVQMINDDLVPKRKEKRARRKSPRLPDGDFEAGHHSDS